MRAPGCNSGTFAVHTLEETAEKFGVSFRRIQQIEAKAFEKLRREMEKRGIKCLKDWFY